MKTLTLILISTTLLLTYTFDIATMPTSQGLVFTNTFNTNLGSSLAIVGDINGDGYDDWVVGADFENQGDGAIYVIFGDASSNLLKKYQEGESDISTFADGTSGFRLYGPPGLSSQLGCSVSRTGDVNADGYADFLVGACNEGSGAVYLIFGNTSANLLHTYGGANLLLDQNIKASVGIRIISSAFGALGSSVSGAGDVNGDGYADFLVGAPAQVAVYLILGNSTSNLVANYGGSTLVLNTLIASSIGYKFVSGNPDNSGLGLVVSGAGDVNADGFDDFLISDMYLDAVYMLFGNTTANLDMSYGNAGFVLREAIPDYVGLKLQGLTNSFTFGYTLSKAGDVNGDGFDDFLVADVTEDSVYVLFGNTSADLFACYAKSNYTVIPNVSGCMGVQVAGNPLSWFGRSLASAGDINNDGYDDFLVGAPFEAAAYLLFGNSSTNLAQTYGGNDFTVNESIHESTGIQFSAVSDVGGLPASAVASAGDLNGDGVNDILVGSGDAVYLITSY